MDYLLLSIAVLLYLFWGYTAVKEYLEENKAPYPIYSFSTVAWGYITFLVTTALFLVFFVFKPLAHIIYS